MQFLKNTLFVGAWVALAASAAPAAAQAFLNMAELKALVSGNTVHFTNLENGLVGRAFHDAGGEVMVDRDDGATFSGLWSVRADGTHCIIFSGEVCGKIRKNADGTYTRVIVGSPGFTWMRITPGKGF
jgi:hypothetical protein